MYSRKRPDSHRFTGGRSHVFCFDFKSLGTCLFSNTPKKIVGTVAHQWIDLIINIQDPAFAHTFCLRTMPHSVTICTKYRHGWTMAYIMCPLVERLFLSPTAYSQIVAQKGPMPKCTIIVSQLVAFFLRCFFFNSVFFSLDATFKWILSAVILSWFGHRPGYYTTINWLLIRFRTPIRCQE